MYYWLQADVGGGEVMGRHIIALVDESDTVTTIGCRLLSGGSGPVLVLGATNRPFDLDSAVLRRFSLQLEVN